MTDGDTFKATIVGGTVTAYINGVQKIQVTDSHPFASGNPGIGFYLANSNRNPAPQAEYGFSSFKATDDSAVSTVSVPSSSRTLTFGPTAPHRPNVALPAGSIGAAILNVCGQHSGVTAQLFDHDRQLEEARKEGIGDYATRHRIAFIRGMRVQGSVEALSGADGITHFSESR